MFVFDRSALAVLAPLALLLAVALYSNSASDNRLAAQSQPEQERADQVAANLPSR
jgi:hypothetical protein